MENIRVADGLLGDISALVDGELPRDQALSTLDQIQIDEQAVQAWHTYHVLGDVMRNVRYAPSPSELEFLDRLQTRLVQESAATRPVSNFKPTSAPTSDPVSASTVLGGKKAVNDAVFRWKALAAVSSLALVLTLAMAVRGGLDDADGTGTLARGSAAEPARTPLGAPQSVAGSEPQMLRDPELDALLAAHQQMGSNPALQGPSGFLRNATYNGPTR